MRLLFCFGFFCLISINVSAYELGVGLHVGLGRLNQDSAVDWVKNAGLDSIRDEVMWASVEKIKKQYELDKTAKRSIDNIDYASGRGISTMLILDYGNDLYGGGHPASKDAIKGFVDYSKYIISSLRFPPKYIEVWNEWNIGAGSKPHVRDGDASEYVDLLKEVYLESKKISPETKVISGAVGDDFPAWKWTKLAMSLGLLRFSDGISVHLYNDSMRYPKGGAFEMYSRLLQLQTAIRQFNAGVGVPLYVTELGVPNHSSGFKESESSSRIISFLLLAKLLDDVKGVWLYEWIDGGDNRMEREHNFGLLRRDKTDKPVSCRLRQLSDFIKNGVIKYRIQNDKYIAYVLNVSGKSIFFVNPVLNGADAPLIKIGFKFKKKNASLYGMPKCGDEFDGNEEFYLGKKGGWHEISINKSSIFVLSDDVKFIR